MKNVNNNKIFINTIDQRTKASVGSNNNNNKSSNNNNNNSNKITTGNMNTLMLVADIVNQLLFAMHLGSFFFSCPFCLFHLFFPK